MLHRGIPTLTGGKTHKQQSFNFYAEKHLSFSVVETFLRTSTATQAAGEHRAPRSQPCQHPPAIPSRPAHGRPPAPLGGSGGGRGSDGAASGLHFTQRLEVEAVPVGRGARPVRVPSVCRAISSPSGLAGVRDEGVIPLWLRFPDRQHGDGLPYFPREVRPLPLNPPGAP